MLSQEQSWPRAIPLLIAIFVAGTVGGIVFAYGVLGLLAGRRTPA